MARNNTCGPFKKTSFNLYSWCPGTPTFNKSLSGGGGIGSSAVLPPYFCTAIAGNQGFDFTNTYVYNEILINGKPNRLAYVECNYMV